MSDMIQNYPGLVFILIWAAISVFSAITSMIDRAFRSSDFKNENEQYLPPCICDRSIKLNQFDCDGQCENPRDYSQCTCTRKLKNCDFNCRPSQWRGDMNEQF